MGEVYKAHDGRLNRTVAIKRIIAEDHSRFESEVRAIAAINHPHLPDLRRRLWLHEESQHHGSEEQPQCADRQRQRAARPC
jgi:serine/threonine protein kinase